LALKLQEQLNVRSAVGLVQARSPCSLRISALVHSHQRLPCTRFIFIIYNLNNKIKGKKYTLEKVGAGIGGLEAQCGLAISQAFAVEAQAKVGRPSIAALIN
jgi:hypothetical protein